MDVVGSTARIKCSGDRKVQRPRPEKALPNTVESEVREIFVRAHTAIAEKQRREQPAPAKWPEEVLVFDTETTIDTAQKLNFGAYRRCKLRSSGYQCVEEGLFYADNLGEV